MNLEELKEKRERLKGYLEELGLAIQLCKDHNKPLAERFLTYNLGELKMKLRLVQYQIEDAEKEQATEEKT